MGKKNVAPRTNGTESGSRPSGEPLAGTDIKHVCFRIDGLRPPNHQKFYAGVHWAVRAQLARDWHQAVQFAMLSAGIKKQPMQNCMILITANMSGRLIDPCNLCAKIIIDGMKRWQTSRSKDVFSARGGDKIKFNDKVAVKGAENARFLFQDDAYPYVSSVTTAVRPSDTDFIMVSVAGIPDE